MVCLLFIELIAERKWLEKLNQREKAEVSDTEKLKN